MTFDFISVFVYQTIVHSSLFLLLTFWKWDLKVLCDKGQMRSTCLLLLGLQSLFFSKCANCNLLEATVQSNESSTTTTPLSWLHWVVVRCFFKATVEKSTKYNSTHTKKSLVGKSFYWTTATTISPAFFPLYFSWQQSNWPDKQLKVLAQTDI